MANLPEIAQFDAGVYQFETTDPLLGGPNGIDNKPLKNLVNRTAWLKAQVDALNTFKQVNDLNVDEMQEAVDFMKANKADIEALAIANILGLQDALDAIAADIISVAEGGLTSADVNAITQQLLINSYTSTSTTKAPTANVVRLINNNLVNLSTAFNAHSHTKSDIGLSNVPNYPATSSVIDPSNTKFATARAVYDLKALVDGKSASSHSHFWSHIQNKPSSFTPSTHGHTKSEVGLSNVPNYPATSSVVDPSNTKFATAGAAKQAYDKGNHSHEFFDSGWLAIGVNKTKTVAHALGNQRYRAKLLIKDAAGRIYTEGSIQITNFAASSFTVESANATIFYGINRGYHFSSTGYFRIVV